MSNHSADASILAGDGRSRPILTGLLCAAVGAGGLSAWYPTAGTAAPTEYLMTYLGYPGDATLQSSGLARFTYDPRTRVVSELVWDLGNDRVGMLDIPDTDGFLGSLLLGTFDPGGWANKWPPDISGYFFGAGWGFVRSPPQFWYSADRGFDNQFGGTFVTRERNAGAIYIFHDRFADPGAANQWESASGNWVRTGSSTYENTAALVTALTTVKLYESIDPSGPPSAVIDESQPYAISARLQSKGTASQARAGLVYNYQDKNNFNEVVFSPAGGIELREVRNGAASLIAADSFEEAGQGMWVDAELRRHDGTTSVYVNGNLKIRDVVQSSLGSDRVGLVTHTAPGQFDDVRILRPRYQWPFMETFSAAAPQRWLAASGNWTRDSGMYVSNVQATALALIRSQTPSGTIGEFGIRARMLNPYGASGNLVGLAWNGGKNEVVFSPEGEARINVRDANGTRTVATAPIPRQRNQWFEVEIDVCHFCFDTEWGATVKLNGAAIFDGLTGENYFPDGSPQGEVGLVTHWSPGRFADVEFRLTPFPQRYAQYFDVPPSEVMIRRGTWDGTGGALNSRAIRHTDIATLPTGTDADFVYRARMVNPYGASGNSVGLITNYDMEGDYYETVFTATGQVYANKVLRGSVTRQATGSHNVPPTRWFDVEVRRVGTLSEVNVNGRTVLANVPQGQLRGGVIGAVTHWSPGRFDEIRFEELHPSAEIPCDFCDHFGSPTAQQWQPRDGDWSVVNRMYVGTGAQDTCGTGGLAFAGNGSLIRNLQASDVELSFDARSFNKLDKGIVLRSSGPGDQIELRLQGDAVAIRELKDCQIVLDQIRYFPVRYRTDVMTRYRISLAGNYLRVWVNDRLVAEAGDFSFVATRGAIGVAVIEGARAAFDNVRVNVLR